MPSLRGIPTRNSNQWSMCDLMLLVHLLQNIERVCVWEGGGGG